MTHRSPSDSPMSPLRSLVHRFVPAQFQDPIGLTRRLLASRDKAAYFAMGWAGLGALATPLDLLLTLAERRRLAAASEPKRPLLFVCGPARSGTTLVAQTLINHLPVAYFSNVTSIFPRAPVTASRLFGATRRRPASGAHSFFGRTAGWGGPNDALYLWDRWLGTDRDRVPTELAEERARAMRRFFGAWEALFDAPLVAKNNSLIGSAALVGAALPTAVFYCLEREPFSHGQALLSARRLIHGTESISYGLGPEDAAADPIESVARQLGFLSRLAQEQIRVLGPGRFRLISYEQFCRDPAAFVRASATDLGLPEASIRGTPSEFRVSTRSDLSPEEAARLRNALDRNGLSSAAS